jgi:gas vesicle protein
MYTYEEDGPRMQVMGMLTAFFIGAAAGAAVALLYAPNDGRRTRDLMAEKVHDLAAKIKTARGRAFEKLSKATEGSMPEMGAQPGATTEAEGDLSGGNGRHV